MENKTTPELISYYYCQWKKSPLYDDFVKRRGGYHGKTRSVLIHHYALIHVSRRRKHLFEPGRDLDGFPRPTTLAYSSDSDSSGSESEMSQGDDAAPQQQEASAVTA